MKKVVLEAFENDETLKIMLKRNSVLWK